MCLKKYLTQTMDYTTRYGVMAKHPNRVCSEHTIDREQAVHNFHVSQAKSDYRLENIWNSRFESHRIRLFILIFLLVFRAV